MEQSDTDYIALNLCKLPEENIIKILLNFREKLDECNARIEKSGVGTFLYLKKINPLLAFHIRRAIEALI